MFPDLNQNSFLFSPTEPTGGVAAPSSPSQGASEPVAATTPAAASVPAPAASASTQASNVGGSVAPSAPAAPAAPASWLEGFRKEGFNAPDEATAQQQLLQAHRDAERLRPLAPHLSAYQQHATEFQQFLAERAKKQAQPAQEDWTAKLGWNPPPGDLSQLRHQVTQDAQGNLIPVAGANPAVVGQYQALQAFRQDQVDKLLANPMKYMEPAIRHIAQEIAQQHAEQGVGAYKEQQEAQGFIQQHSNWLFDKGQDGQVKTTSVINPQTGRYESQRVLSNWGQTFVNHLQEAAKRGLPVDLQQDYALKAVQNAYMLSPEYAQYLSQQQQTPPAAPAAPAAPAGSARQQANAAFTQRANPAATPAPAGGNAIPTPQTVNRNNLEQVMLKRLQDAGASTT